MIDDRYNEESKLKSIAFDLDTKALKENYKKGDWHNAYNDIRNFMKQNHFKHIQGSVYDSTIKMTDYQLQILVENLCQKFDWFSSSIKDIRGNDQPRVNNLTPIAKANLKPLIIEIKPKSLQNKSNNKSSKKSIKNIER